MNILIAGAGIGGLTAALCLAKAGHKVQLFDQASEFAEVGAGIQCGANALHVMQHLELLEPLLELSVEPERIEFCDHVTAEVFYSAELGADYRQKYGAPYLHLHRSDLHRTLLVALQQAANAELHLTSEVVSFRESASSVTVDLRGGGHCEGDCLIAADGIRSKLRGQLLGDTEPRFTGNVAWRGVLDVNRLPKNFMQRIARNFVGPNKHMVVYYLRNQRLLNFVGVVQNSDWREDSWVAKAPWEDLKRDFTGWHPMVQTMIDAVDKEQCFRWALYDHAPLKNWSSKRITLLGDAAHATLPFMASGAAMAIEDGRILQRALDQESSLASALALYQTNRFARTAEIQRNSARLGRLYHIRNRVAQRLAFSMLGVVGRRKERFLPDYNANSVTLI